MQEFIQKCGECKFSGQALHWYDTTADNAIAHFKRHHDEFKLPIYNTEIAFNNFNGGNQLSKDQAFSEMGKFNDWVKGDGSDFMKVVMYFGKCLLHLYFSTFSLVPSQASKETWSTYLLHFNSLIQAPTCPMILAVVSSTLSDSNSPLAPAHCSQMLWHASLAKLSSEYQRWCRGGKCVFVP